MNSISIITINYNNFLGLEKTLSSIYNQTFSDFEHILIDGGSTDKSLDIIKNYKDKLSYWVSEKDNGIYNAMNKGVLKASNDYIIFLNSGDEFNNTKALENAFKNDFDSDLISFKINYIDENSIRTISPPIDIQFSYMFSKTLPHPSTFIKRTLFRTVGLYDENLKIASDWKFFILSLFKYDCTYKSYTDVLVNFYLDGISSNNVIANEGENVLLEYFPRFINDYTRLNQFNIQSTTYTYKLYYKLKDKFLFKKICSLIYKLFYK